MAAVVIFVRQKKTFKFLNERGEWTGSFEEARTFGSTWEAIDTCMKQEVCQAEVVMRMGAPRYDMVLDVA